MRNSKINYKIMLYKYAVAALIAVSASAWGERPNPHMPHRYPSYNGFQRPSRPGPHPQPRPSRPSHPYQRPSRPMVDARPSRPHPVQRPQYGGYSYQRPSRPERPAPENAHAPGPVHRPSGLKYQGDAGRPRGPMGPIAKGPTRQQVDRRQGPPAPRGYLSQGPRGPISFQGPRTQYRGPVTPRRPSGQYTPSGPRAGPRDFMGPRSSPIHPRAPQGPRPQPDGPRSYGRRLVEGPRQRPTPPFPGYDRGIKGYSFETRMPNRRDVGGININRSEDYAERINRPGMLGKNDPHGDRTKGLNFDRAEDADKTNDFGDRYTDDRDRTGDFNFGRSSDSDRTSNASDRGAIDIDRSSDSDRTLNMRGYGELRNMHASMGPRYRHKDMDFHKHRGPRSGMRDLDSEVSRRPTDFRDLDDPESGYNGPRFGKIDLDSQEMRGPRNGLKDLDNYIKPKALFHKPPGMGGSKGLSGKQGLTSGDIENDVDIEVGNDHETHLILGDIEGQNFDHENEPEEEVEVDIEEGPEVENIGEEEIDHEVEDAGTYEMDNEAEINHDFENTNDFETGEETEIKGEIEEEDDIEEELGNEIAHEEENTDEAEVTDEAGELETHDPFGGMSMGKSLKDQFSEGSFGGKFTPGIGLSGLMKTGAIGGMTSMGGGIGQKAFHGYAAPQPSFQHVSAGPRFQPQQFAVPTYQPVYSQPYTMGHGW